MAKFSSTVTTVTVDASPGGAAKIITPYVDSINGMALETITEQSNPFGSTAEGHTPVGMDKSPDLVLSGLYDNVADVGSWTVLKQVAGDKAVASVGRLVSILAATGATWSGHYHLVRTEVQVTNGKLTRYSSLFRPAQGTTGFDGAWS
jgi:hypothetical protein